MDQLRSLEGMSRLLVNDKHDEKPQMTRTVSLMPRKMQVNPLKIIQAESPSDMPEMSIRSYSSRGQAVPSDYKQDTDASTAPKPVQKSGAKLSLPSLSNPSSSKKQPSNKSIKSNLNFTDNLLSINEILSSGADEDDDEDADQGFTLLSQLSARSEFSDFGGGFGLGGLNMDLMEDVADYDENNDNEWYNDQVLAQVSSFSPKPEDAVIEEEDEKHKIVITADPKQETKTQSKKDVPRFPFEEFEHYKSRDITNNKEIASDVYVIGGGSFGIVIKSFHLMSCETVAIKQCRISCDDKLLQLFISEADYYETFVDSPYIVDMLGFGRHEETSKLCIALEYMDLHSIAQIDYKLNDAQIMYVSFAIVSALQCMHGAHCIHNDVKPDNILISSRGDVKLTDFGCCITNEKEDHDMTDHICGSKQYYAPEKWLISPPKYNTLSDIWSFGVSLYEIITLRQNDAREFGYSESPQLEHKNAILCDFVHKMVMWKANERWSAAQLLKHPFLTRNKTETIKKVAFNYNNEARRSKKRDLKFMVDALIEYYSNEHFFEEKKESKKEYSDKEKIENLCKHSGCTVKEVNRLIRFAVDAAKAEIQKNTAH
eukprot:13919_1